MLYLNAQIMFNDWDFSGKKKKVKEGACTWKNYNLFLSATLIFSVRVMREKPVDKFIEAQGDNVPC